MHNTSRPRRITQVLCLTALIMFINAILHGVGSRTQSMRWPDVYTLLEKQNGRESLRDFMARSEAIWAKTVKQRHKMISDDYPNGTMMPLFPSKDGASYYAHPYTIWDFAPASYNCPHDMERIGRMGDGGKWVCGMSKYVDYPADRECVIYSFGVRDESSFEQEMLERTNCVVWAYDFSVVDFGKQLAPSHRNRAYFNQIGIAGKTDLTKNPPFYSIADLMKKNGHTYIDILKMDIEYAEFEGMDAMHEDFPLPGELPIGQFMVEIHMVNDITTKQFIDWWERLEARGMRASWTEPNLVAVVLATANKDPFTAEYTMINVKNKNNVLVH